MRKRSFSGLLQINFAYNLMFKLWYRLPFFIPLVGVEFRKMQVLKTYSSFSGFGSAMMYQSAYVMLYVEIHNVAYLQSDIDQQILLNSKREVIELIYVY